MSEPEKIKPVDLREEYDSLVEDVRKRSLAVIELVKDGGIVHQEMTDCWPEIIVHGFKLADGRQIDIWVKNYAQINPGGQIPEILDIVILNQHDDQLGYSASYGVPHKAAKGYQTGLYKISVFWLEGRGRILEQPKARFSDYAAGDMDLISALNSLKTYKVILNLVLQNI